MLTLANGNKYRDVLKDTKTLEGYTLQDDGKTFVQNFLPCGYRYNKQCAVCPKSRVSRTRPACKLLNINSHLNCVGCLKRDPYAKI